MAALDSARSVAAAGRPSRAALEALGGGWTGEEALAIALACALTADPGDVASALWRAAAHGGDSDSTASLTGNLLGASLGTSALPPRWCAQVEMADLITRLARDLHRAASGGTTFDACDYPPVDGVFAAR